MEQVQDYLKNLQADLTITVALLNALRALHSNNQLHVLCGKQVLVLDFFEEICLIEVALCRLNVDVPGALVRLDEGNFL